MRCAKAARMLMLGIAGAVVAAASPASAAYVSAVIVNGLNNPRGLAFGPDGGLYIAESGYVTDASPTAIINGDTFRYDTTGSITLYANGAQARVVTGLATVLTPMDNIIGPQDIAFDANGTGHVVTGIGAHPGVRAALGPVGPGLGHVFSFNNGGGVESVADVSAVEGNINPDGGVIDSNPFHLARANNALLVTDSGGNSLLRLEEDGTLSVIATFPQRDIGGGFPSDPVPTGVVVGPDGNYYIAELTGFPFTEGAARIYQVTPTGEVSVALDGFTNITDIAFDDVGNLYVLQLDDDGMATGGPGGSLIRVGLDGERETIFSDLFFPTGLEIGPDGAFYIANMSVLAGQGQVLRITQVPEPMAVALFGLGLGGVALMRRRRSAPAVNQA